MKFLLKLLFWPGDTVLRFLGVSAEQDSGIARSLINSTVWGIVAIVILMRYMG